MTLQGEARALLDTGRAAMNRFDLPVAMEAMQRCVALAPDDVEARVCFGMAFMAREPARAGEALDRALGLSPRDAAALYWRAESHWLQGDPRSAAAVLRRLARILLSCGVTSYRPDAYEIDC